jgi:hypothetical protein
VIHLAILAFVGALTGQASGQRPAIDWLTVAVEREAFTEASPGQYAARGDFDGVAVLYLSATKKILELKGLRRATLPHLGQQPNQLYEIYHETFKIESLILIGDGEYAFQGVNNGPFDRTITGKVRYSVAASGLVGSVDEFQLAEQGQVIKGVMNRYAMARSTQATTMLKKHDDVFFGGNYVVLDFGR